MAFCLEITVSSDNSVRSDMLFSCPYRHGENCAGVIAAVLNNSNCGVGVAFKAKLGGELQL